MTAYHDLDSPQTMRRDAAVAGARLPLVAPRLAYTDVYARASGHRIDPSESDGERQRATSLSDVSMHMAPAGSAPTN